jgi:hypothetical protein
MTQVTNLGLAPRTALWHLRFGGLVNNRDGREAMIYVESVREWLDDNKEVEDQLERLIADLIPRLGADVVERATTELSQKGPGACLDQGHIWCSLLADLAVDLSDLAGQPVDLAIGVVADVYPPPVRGEAVSLTAKRAFLESLVTRLIALTGFSAVNILAMMTGTAALACCPDPDRHTGLQEACDLALGRFLKAELVPGDMLKVALLCSRIEDVTEEQLTEAETAQTKARLQAQRELESETELAAKLAARRAERLAMREEQKRHIEPPRPHVDIDNALGL